MCISYPREVGEAFDLTSRRKFLVHCTAISAAAVLTPGLTLAAGVPPVRRPLSWEEMDGATFAQELHTPFRIHAGPARSILVTLEEVRFQPAAPLSRGRHSPAEAGGETFSLIFSGRRSELLGQETYAIEHAHLGRFELFIVPVFTRNPAKIDYAAVINRPRTSDLQFARSRTT
jgi:hypothetical protein